jgi:hypothetical protein
MAFPIGRPVVLLCDICGGFLGCSCSWEPHPKHTNQIQILVPRARDVSLVYGGGCECTMPVTRLVYENGEDGS